LRARARCWCVSDRLSIYLSDFCERIADCFFGLAGEAIDVFRCGEPHRKSEMPFYAHVLRTITQALPRARLKAGRSHLKSSGYDEYAREKK